MIERVRRLRFLEKLGLSREKFAGDGEVGKDLAFVLVSKNYMVEYNSNV